jgi:hypothetical protein
MDSPSHSGVHIHNAVRVDGDDLSGWSPDGSQIAFGRDGNIWIIDVGAVAVEPATWGAIKARYR